MLLKSEYILRERDMKNLACLNIPSVTDAFPGVWYFHNFIDSKNIFRANLLICESVTYETQKEKKTNN